MAHGQFIWCDLSVFETGVARQFYGKVLGWEFEQDRDYQIGHKDGNEICGVFEMPDQFQKIGMPAFWMSYIGTQDLDRTCKDSVKLGGKVELGPEAFGDQGRFALIRDPLGAGFTAYEGDLDVPTQHKHGHRLGHGLFVEDAKKIIPFYSGLFGWDFYPPENGVYDVCLDQQLVCHCHEISNAKVRGKGQYWAIYFDIANLSDALHTITEAGGKLVQKLDLPDGKAAFVRDVEGAVFVLVDRQSKSLSWFDILLGAVFVGWAI